MAFVLAFVLSKLNFFSETVSVIYFGNQHKTAILNYFTTREDLSVDKSRKYLKKKKKKSW